MTLPTRISLSVFASGACCARNGDAARTAARTRDIESAVCLFVCINIATTPPPGRRSLPASGAYRPSRCRKNEMLMAEADLSSPLPLAGEVGLHRRCNPGGGSFHIMVVRLVARPPPQPSPQAGEGAQFPHGAQRNVMSSQPNGLTATRSPLPTRTVVVSASMIAGPASAWPGLRSSSA